MKRNPDLASVLHHAEVSARLLDIEVQDRMLYTQIHLGFTLFMLFNSFSTQLPQPSLY
jgi:hypothetical protein